MLGFLLGVHVGNEFRDGGVKGFLEAVGNGVSGRLNSPFAFGFMVSVIFINWDSFLILAFSNESIESRIGLVSDNININLLLVRPFFVSIFGVLFFNMGGVLFSFISGFFDLISRGVYRYLNKKGWVKVEDSLRSRALLDERVLYLERLASGDLSELEDRNLKVDSLNKKIEEMEKEISKRVDEINDLLKLLKRKDRDLFLANSECAELRLKISDMCLNYAWIGEEENFRYNVLRFIQDTLDMVFSNRHDMKIDIIDNGERLSRYIRLMGSVSLPDGV